MKTLCLLVATYMSVGIAALSAQKKRPVPTAADVRYGRYDRNLLDFWQAPGATAENPAPVLIFYHGGGWVGGDKKVCKPTIWLGQGISVVSVNYRFTTGHADAAPYPAPMEDGARALQFVRSKAKEWHLDPDKVALSGSSAGAVMALWIGTRDDMRIPDSKDPIERISTRVTCLIPTDVPTTLHPKLILERIGGSPELHPAFLPFFQIKKIADLEKNPEKAALLRYADPFTHLSADDPPTFTVFNRERCKVPVPADANVNLSIHHPEFGFMLKEKLDALGVEAHVQHKGDGQDPATFIRFVLKQLKGTAVPSGE